MKQILESEIILLKHALMHLESNKIHIPSETHSAWYCGNKAQFINRHIKAIQLLNRLTTKEVK